MTFIELEMKYGPGSEHYRIETELRELPEGYAYTWFPMDYIADGVFPVEHYES